MKVLRIRQLKPRPKIRPVYVMHESGVTFSENEAVLEGIREVIAHAGLEGKLPVQDWGEWNMGSGDYESVEWYINRAKQTGRAGRGHGPQLNAGNLMLGLECEPWKKSNDHYDVLVCSSDMWDGSNRTNFVIGVARPNESTVLSVRRFRGLRKRMAAECVKTETIHELGHVFGLIPYERKSNVEHSLGKHCANVCSMRQGLTVPTDWEKYTKDRLANGALCPQCIDDLKDYFRRE